MYNQSHPELQDQHPMGQFLPVRHESRFPGGEPPIPVQHGTYIDQGGLQSNMYLEDDQYWDVSDDEELMADSGDEGGQTSGHLLSNDQGVQVLARLRERQGSFDTHIRTFSAMGTGFALTNYRPSLSNSPLTDTQTAAIFWHFVTVTGPSMSLYERHPVDPSPMFSGEPVPTTKQHIWTCKFAQIHLPGSIDANRPACRHVSNPRVESLSPSSSYAGSGKLADGQAGRAPTCGLLETLRNLSEATAEELRESRQTPTACNSCSHPPPWVLRSVEFGSR